MNTQKEKEGSNIPPFVKNLHYPLQQSELKGADQMPKPKHLSFLGDQ